MDKKLSSIAEVASLITSSFDVERILAFFMESLLKIMNADVGSVMLTKDKILSTEIEWGLDHDTALSLKTSAGISICEDSFNKSKMVYINNNVHKDKLIAPDIYNIQSILTIPLEWQGKTIGVANIVNFECNDKIPNDQMESLTSLCSLAVVAIENARLHKEILDNEILRREMEIASKVQKSLLPEGLPDFDDIEIKSFFSPATEIGGDYYDVLKLDENTIVVTIGDAAGHGVSSGMQMAGLRSLVRILVKEGYSASKLLEKLNTEICRDSSKYDDAFITFCYILLDIKEMKGTISNAGHPLPFLLRAAKASEISEGNSLVLGLMQDVIYDEYQFELMDGDGIFLYTDGLTEHKNDKNNLFGKEQLSKILEETSDTDIEFQLSRIVNSLSLWESLDAKSDDITFLSMKIKRKN